MDRQTKGRLTFLAIGALFALPIAAAAWLYFADTGWRPATSTEHGELIVPAVQLPETVATSDGTDLALRDTWSLIVIGDPDCGTECSDALVRIRQIRLSLGPKMTRLQTVYLPAAAADFAALRADHPQLVVVSPGAAGDLRGLIAGSRRTGGYNTGDIFLADPLGNVMMVFGQDLPMGDVRKDIAHLFELSRIG